MTYKYAGFAALILILAAVVGPSPIFAQEDGFEFRLSNFRIELTGGWARIAPGNINRAVENENAYLNYYYLTKYAYYDSAYGDAFTAAYTYTAGKEFAPLESLTPYGAALRYQVSPTFALSLGVQFLRGEKASDVGLDVAVDGSAAGAPYTAHYRNAGFVVSIDGYMPYLGANFGWDFFKVLRAEIYLMGGPIIGDCRVYSRRDESVTTEAGTTVSGFRTMEISGRSESVAIEMGSQLRLRILPFLDVFGQCGYAFRKLTRIHGTHAIETVTELPVPSETDYSMSGTWGISWESATSAWGTYRAPLLTTNFNPMGRNAVGTTVANGELSGLQLQGGISIRL